MSLLDLSSAQRAELAEKVRADYDALKAKGLNLNLTRGKPSAEQLDFSNELLDMPGRDEFLTPGGEDIRNYGNLRGVKEIRELWSELIGIPADQLIAGDSSSLNIMFDLVTWSCLFGNNDSERPWSQEEKVKWLCPVPGYDRHFTITERLGFEMIPVPILADGPDIAAISKLVKDPQVKGMWAVPVFGNPSGVVFSEAVCRALAEMETAAPDFRIVWDNAYAVHTLTNEFPPVYDVLGFAAQAGHPNRFWCMSSTSKITFAGAGVSFFGSSKENLDWYTGLAGVRGIGPNKVNQYAHVRYFGDAEGVRALMRKHAGSLAPKFRAVENILEARLGEYGVARWTTPQGGYFISLDVVDGTAARVVELAREAGIALTGAGSSFPLHQDPNDRNIRLSPSFPPEEELVEAMDGVATCVLLAAFEKLGE